MHSFYEWQKTVIVKQFLHTKCEPVVNIFSSLQDVSGLIWMKDNYQNIIGLLPKWQCIPLDNQQTLVLKRHGLACQSYLSKGCFTDCVKQAWQESKPQGKVNSNVTLSAVENESIDKNIMASPAKNNSSKDFSGGLMGFVGYDLAAAQHIDLKDQQNTQAPQASLGNYDIFLKQVANGWALYGPDLAELQPIYDYIHALLNAAENNYPLCEFSALTPFQPVWNKTQYAQAFARIQHYLTQGDCYQVNLTQPFVASVKGSLLAAIEPLMQLTKASYAGYMRYNDFELLSCSPELFVAFEPNGKIITKPIKGTQPRHADPQLDAKLKQQLMESEKDRAENLMIVDLLRNDLSVYAQTGSVHVPALFEIESFAQVHHLVSEIHATLLPDASPLDVLFNALPGGSITGAPKIRAMQIIDELEAAPRGAYCGSMGYLNYDNTGQFNILIRSLQKRGDTLTVWAGGGITIASKCEDEYQECLDKVGAILACVEKIGADCQAQDN